VGDLERVGGGGTVCWLCRGCGVAARRLAVGFYFLTYVRAEGAEIFASECVHCTGFVLSHGVSIVGAAAQASPDGSAVGVTLAGLRAGTLTPGIGGRLIRGWPVAGRGCIRLGVGLLCEGTGRSQNKKGKKNSFSLHRTSQGEFTHPPTEFRSGGIPLGIR
jgi:hypothetical protein